MAELRYNPVIRDWLMVASHRQTRPQMPKDWCPFCVGSGKVPDEGFDVLRYPNDFPALSINPPEPDDVSGGNGLFVARPAYGCCEVLLYSDRHEVRLSELSDEHVCKLAEMWREVYKDLANDPLINYVFIFENRGETVGVTMPHPHGQVYGYPFVPRFIGDELEGAKAHFNTNGSCLFCDLLTQEVADGRRMIHENEHFALYTPFFAQTAYASHITAKRHVSNIAQMTDAELDALGRIVRDTSAMYDALFDMPFPYMMCMHCAPTDGASDAFYHFHIEFIPPMRAADKQQFFASSEMGAGAFCNPTCPEEKAAELRRAWKKANSE
jgi:UDPglucose--hexose-1-phosphate uridylyltransferase